MIGQLIIEFPKVEMEEILERSRFRLRQFDLLDPELMTILTTMIEVGNQSLLLNVLKKKSDVVELNSNHCITTGDESEKQLRLALRRASFTPCRMKLDPRLFTGKWRQHLSLLIGMIADVFVTAENTDTFKQLLVRCTKLLPYLQFGRVIIRTVIFTILELATMPHLWSLVFG